MKYNVEELQEIENRLKSVKDRRMYESNQTIHLHLMGNSSIKSLSSSAERTKQLARISVPIKSKD